MKHRSAPTPRSRARHRGNSSPVGRPRGVRLLLGSLLTASATAVVLAVPVVSGAGDGVQGASSSSAVFTAAEERSEGRSPVVMGVDGAPATSPQAPAPESAPASAEPAPAATAGGSRAAAPAGSAPVPTSSAADCEGPGRTVQRPYGAGTVLSAQWKQSRTPDDATYDLTGVTSTAFPSTQHPFNTGTSTPGARTCVVGGELRGTIDPARSWEFFHDEANAACVKVVAVEWLTIHGTRCDGVEDGFRPQEGGINLNRTRFTISGTYLSNVADDCIENDYTLGGVLRDNLWESCFTGISERPSSANGTWTSPADETLTLDHMLIGLRSMPHDSGKGTGPNALFKWSTSANKVVVKCSVFFVPGHSVNGTDTMAIPEGTVIDDSACPNNPSTIVWLGGGDYPAPTQGMRVVSDRTVWDNAVRAWKAAHGHA